MTVNGPPDDYTQQLRAAFAEHLSSEPVRSKVMTKLEEVAAALVDEYNVEFARDYPRRGSYGELDDESKKLFRGLARTAIAVMRAATDGQRNAYYAICRDAGETQVSSIFNDSTWERMIDAVLNEGRETEPEGPQS